MDPSVYQSGSQLPPQAAAGVLVFVGILLLVLVVVAIALYVFFAICLMKIAKKTKTENAWFAWIPILNIILMVDIAKKPMWWIVLFFIPLANIVVTILVWMEIAKVLKKPDWLGILMIVPIANIVVPGYLAFSKDELVQPVVPEQVAA